MIMRSLVVIVALIGSTIAGASVSAFGLGATAKGQQVVESRVVDVRGNHVLLHDGTRAPEGEERLEVSGRSRSKRR